MDMDSHPSCSISCVTGTLTKDYSGVYPLMVRNFLGEVANFYLNDSSFTRLESKTIDRDAQLTFDSGSTYMARITLRRSMTGSRNYFFESASSNANDIYTVHAEQFPAYTENGGRGIVTTSAGMYWGVSHYFPLPQDPKNAPGYHETFTMYSRTTAFGPPVGGLSADQGTRVMGSPARYNTDTVLDSFTGYNPAYTPPYHNGEAWCDLIFRPRSGKTYNMNSIMSEVSTSYWRFDPGYASSSMAGGGRARTTLIYDDTAITGPFKYRPGAPYCGHRINENSMQLSASIQVFGLEPTQWEEASSETGEITTRNEYVGDKWIIQPKWETPMLNFNDLSDPRYLTSSQITMPQNFGQASVPRGMWHQFGIIDPDKSRGIYLEIDDIPYMWLNSHYDVLVNDTVYNNYDARGTYGQVSSQAKSLTDLLGFEERSKKLGRLKESLTVKEAVIAVPYVIYDIFDISESKRFINIPEDRIAAATRPTAAGTVSDSLTAAGVSIRKQLAKMNDYILPPEIDFLNNPDIDPMVIYIFEFEYTFDQDDLSYMWQNLAPPDYKQITVQSEAVSHELGDSELLSEANLEEGENLRWMVFKVKQRSQKDYNDFKADLLGSVITPSTSMDGEEDPVTVHPGTTFNVMFNWPYDHLSFVEKIKMDVQVLYERPDNPESSGDWQEEPEPHPGTEDALRSILDEFGPPDGFDEYSGPTRPGTEGSSGPTTGPIIDLGGYSGPIYDPITGQVISEGSSTGPSGRGTPVITTTTDVLKGPDEDDASFAGVEDNRPQVSESALDWWKSQTPMVPLNLQGFKFNKP
jgi:hypothetical protein